MQLGRVPKALFLSACTLIFLIGTLLPVVAILARSLLATRSIGLDLGKLQFGGYLDLFKSSFFAGGATNSFVLAALTATIVCVFGLVISIQNVRSRPSWLNSASDYLIALPIAVPGTVFGIGMLWAYVVSPIYGTVLLLLIAFVARYTIYGVKMMGTGLMQIDKELEEAATVSGSGPVSVFRRISLPLLRGTAMSVWLLVFLTVMRELSASVMIYGVDSETLPILTWTYLNDGSYGIASALAMIQIVAVGLVVLLMKWIFGSEVKLNSRSS